MSRKNKNLILILALIVIFGVVTSTVAYDTVETRTRNLITTGSVEISIQETSPALEGYISSEVKNESKGIVFTDILPGETASKTVNIKNESETCWLRVKVESSVKMPDGSSDPKDFQSMIGINFDMVSGNWKLESDGYYYYQNPLQKGESTVSPLFDKVTFAPQMGNEYAGCTVTIKVTAEAIQYKNNEDGLLAWGGED